jgi:hypothetical protein
VWSFAILAIEVWTQQVPYPDDDLISRSFVGLRRTFFSSCTDLYHSRQWLWRSEIVERLLTFQMMFLSGSRTFSSDAGIEIRWSDLPCTRYPRHSEKTPSSGHLQLQGSFFRCILAQVEDGLINSGPLSCLHKCRRVRSLFVMLLVAILLEDDRCH